MFCLYILTGCLNKCFSYLLLFFFVAVKKKENNIKLKSFFGIPREKIVATRFGLQSVS